MEWNPGFLFKPSDDQLVTYLYEKVYGGEQARIDRVVLGECDIYGDKEPWQIWDENGGSKIKASEDLYLFTKLKKVSVHGSNCKRAVGSGTWSGANSVVVCGGLAKKKHFSYEKKGCSEHDGEWIMHEYSLIDGSPEYVLCRLRRRIKRKIKRTETKLMSSIETKNISYVSEEESHGEIMVKKQRLGVESNQDPIPIQHLSHVEDQQDNILSSKSNHHIENVSGFGSFPDQQSKCVDLLEFGDDAIDFGFLFDWNEPDLKENGVQETECINAAAAVAKSSTSSSYDHMAKSTSGEQDLKEISREECINTAAVANKPSSSSTYDHMEVAQEHGSSANNNVAKSTPEAAYLSQLKDIPIYYIETYDYQDDLLVDTVLDLYATDGASLFFDINQGGDQACVNHQPLPLPLPLPVN